MNRPVVRAPCKNWTLPSTSVTRICWTGRRDRMTLENTPKCCETSADAGFGAPHAVAKETCVKCPHADPAPTADQTISIWCQRYSKAHKLQRIPPNVTRVKRVRIYSRAKHYLLQFWDPSVKKTLY